MAPARLARVLVFNVDDALFAVHIDWVEAMYPCAAVRVHVVKGADGRAREFVLHGGEPAAAVDLRDAFGLGGELGRTVRADYLIVRSPSFLLALPIDACVGIRGLDLERTPPLPSSLLRDGGFPVGHLTALDGKPITVLDPSHLLESAERDALAETLVEARSFQRRETKIAALWRELCATPDEATLRNYARLTRRNGNVRMAAAARAVLRHVEATPDEAAAAPEERLLRELVCLWREGATGEVVVPQADDVPESRILLAGGHIVQTHHRGGSGGAAFQAVLASHPEHFYFSPAEVDEPEPRIADSSVALMVSAMAALGDRRRRSLS